MELQDQKDVLPVVFEMQHKYASGSISHFGSGTNWVTVRVADQPARGLGCGNGVDRMMQQILAVHFLFFS